MISIGINFAADSRCQLISRSIFGPRSSKWTCPIGRVPEVFMCGSACRTKAARSGRINKTNTMYDAILHTSRLSVPEAMVSTYDRQVLSRVQWTPSKSLRYLYLLSATSTPSSRTRRFTMDFRAVQSPRDRFVIGSIAARILTPFQTATLSSRYPPEMESWRKFGETRAVDWKVTKQSRGEINISNNNEKKRSSRNFLANCV